MADPWFLLFAFIGLAVLIAAGVGLALLLPILLRHFKGSSGGWSRLSTAYASAEPPPADVLNRQTLVAGQILYRNCVAVGVTTQGLYLRVAAPAAMLFPTLRKAPLLIPWTEFKRVEEGRLYWRKAAVLSLGHPLVGTITLPMSLYEMVRLRLSPAVQSGWPC